MDPLKDYPHGRGYGTRTVSAERAKKQWVERALLKRVLEADWARTGYGYGTVVHTGPGVGEKRKMGDGGVGRGKRVRVGGGEGVESGW